MSQVALITGGNFVNQGAFLMLAAASQQVRSELGMQPAISVRFGSERQKRWLGLETLLAEERLGAFPRVPAGMSRSSTSKFLNRLPFVTADQVTAVFDITGFAFGDQWAHAPIGRRAQNYARWQRKGVPVYMLPQALGPFTKTAAPAELAMSSSRFVFARDPDSFSYASELLPAATHIRLAPDFTSSIKGRSHREFPIGGVHIVPNWNIVERAPSTESANRYLDNLTAVARNALDSGSPVLGISHEGARDLKIVEELKARVPGVEVVSGFDGVELKAILATASLVVSARYHALVSALSQSVPSIMHGWSHKYRWLAEDFDTPYSLLDPYSETSTILDAVVSVPERSADGRLDRAATSVKAKTAAMWDSIASDLRSESH